MSVNKHSAVMEWIKPYFDEQSEVISFEEIDATPGFRSLVPQYGDFKVRSDIVGNITKQYTFGIVAIETFDQYGTDGNADSRFNIETFNDWIEIQQINRNFPDFGETILRYTVSPLYNMANLAQVYKDGQIAKYILMATIEYVEKGY